MCLDSSSWKPQERFPLHAFFALLKGQKDVESLVQRRVSRYVRHPYWFASHLARAWSRRPGTERDYRSAKQILLYAHHEAGHAFVWLVHDLPIVGAILDREDGALDGTVVLEEERLDEMSDFQSLLLSLGWLAGESLFYWDKVPYEELIEDSSNWKDLGDIGEILRKRWKEITSLPIGGHELVWIVCQLYRLVGEHMAPWKDTIQDIWRYLARCDVGVWADKDELQEAMSHICKLRGIDVPNEIISEEEFWRHCDEIFLRVIRRKTEGL